jgi:hypothetical protein
MKPPEDWENSPYKFGRTTAFSRPRPPLKANYRPWVFFEALASAVVLVSLIGLLCVGQWVVYLWGL